MSVLASALASEAPAQVMTRAVEPGKKDDRKKLVELKMA